jgi:predicted esterase
VLLALSLVVQSACGADSEDVETVEEEPTAKVPDGGSDGVEPADGGAPAEEAGSGAGHGEPTTTSPTDTATNTEPTECGHLVEGFNQGFVVDGEARSFMLALPEAAEEDGPWPVVFNWHGLGDTAFNMHALVAGLADYGEYPFIGVTPEDRDFAIMGLPMDWEIANVTGANGEARFFDELVRCLDEQYGVDHDRVHAMGFSLGGIVANLLGVVRGDKIASLATYSAGYLSNPANVQTLGMLASFINWPEWDGGPGYAQLLVHGGEQDIFNLVVTTANLWQFNHNDLDYLTERGHPVLFCGHELGHRAPPPGLPPQRFLDFFKAHPRGSVGSAYATALPPTFASMCAFHAPL